MAEQDTSKTENESQSPFGVVMVGSAIDNRCNEFFVAICAGHGTVRLSVEGARLMARQINEWADFAENRNKEARTIHLTYKVVTSEAPEEKPVWKNITPDETAPPDSQPSERANAIFALRKIARKSVRKKLNKLKTAKRKAA